MPCSRALSTAACLLVLGGLTSSCAGMLSRIFSRPDALPSDIPKNLQDKFQVKDVPEAPPAQGAQKGPTVQESKLVGPVEQGPSPASIAATAEAMVSVPQPEMERKGRHHHRHSKRRTIAGFVGPLLPTFVYPDRRPASEPIWSSEHLVYDVSYFGVSAGDFILDTLPPKEVAGRRVYHIRGSAHSSKVFSVFYKLDDMAETFIDYYGYFSHRFHISLQETKQARDSIELYDSERGQTYYWNRWDRPGHPTEETKVLKPMDPFPQDMLSGLYYLRSVPLPDGGSVDFPVVSEGNTVTAHVTVVRREMMDSPMGRVRCVVVKPEAKTHGVMEKKGDSFMWLTDDDHRILVRLEAKVKVGTLVASLKQADLGPPPTAVLTPAMGSTAPALPHPVSQ